jgi:glycosyltransferase involved in cell wall biosynthesis
VIGGAQVHVRDLATRLATDGHEVRVITGAPGPLTEALTAAGVACELCPGLLREIHPLYDSRAVAALRRSMRAFAPDLVSTHSSKAGVVGRIAARLAGRPCLFTAHGWAFTEGVPAARRTLYRALERATAPLATRIICVSERDRLLAEAAGIASGRLVVIHNGMPDIPADLRANPGRPGRLKLVMVARFDRQKDHRTLLLALRDLDEVDLDLVGDGPAEVEIMALAASLGLSDRVAFLGRRTDVAAVLAGAHAFVLSSHWEGFPRSTLEAMRAGLPVVVTDAGGAAEAVVDGVTGYVVARSNVADMRARLARLAIAPDLRGALGAAGRQRYERRFTFERMYRETIAAYSAVLAAAPFVGDVSKEQTPEGIT